VAWRILMRARKSLWAVVVLCLVLQGGPALADECDESADCPQGSVCRKGECWEVTPECAAFCEAMVPCFSGDGEECTGVASISVEDGGVIETGEVIEECHPVEADVDALIDDCQGDCSSAMADAQAAAFFTVLMECMEAADYSCDAMDFCADEAGARVTGTDMYDVVPSYESDIRLVLSADVTSGGPQKNDEAEAGAADATGDKPSGSSSSSCALDPGASPEALFCLLVALAVLTVFRRRRA
jgi:hypothetical protein